MKRIFAAILALCMIFALCACGAEESAPAVSTTETPTTEAAAEPVTIKVVASFAGDAVNTAIAEYFMTKVEEKVPGMVVFDSYIDGTVCAQTEELDFVTDGSVDMCFSQGGNILAKAPELLGVSMYGDTTECIEFANELLYDNAETAAVYAEAAARQNLVVLSVLTSGRDVVACTSDFDGFDDLKDNILGTPLNQQLYESMGISTVSAIPPDMYDSMSRGVFDCTVFSAGGFASFHLYEVAPYVQVIKLVNSGCDIAINKDVFDSLTPEVQAALQEAARETATYSAEAYDEYTEEVVEMCSSTGKGKATYMSDEESEAFVRKLFTAATENMMGPAENLGGNVPANCEVILKAFADKFGFDY